jgi:hypothetical protein
MSTDIWIRTLGGTFLRYGWSRAGDLLFRFP